MIGKVSSPYQLADKYRIRKGFSLRGKIRGLTRRIRTIELTRRTRTRRNKESFV